MKRHNKPKMSAPTLNGNGISRFESLTSAKLFPGRKSLYPFEVADALGVSIRQVHRYVETGLVETQPISCANTCRTHRRIPCEQYDALLERLFGK